MAWQEILFQQASALAISAISGAIRSGNPGTGGETAPPSMEPSRCPACEAQEHLGAAAGLGGELAERAAAEGARPKGTEVVGEVIDQHLTKARTLLLTVAADGPALKPQAERVAADLDGIRQGLRQDSTIAQVKELAERLRTAEVECRRIAWDFNFPASGPPGPDPLRAWYSQAMAEGWDGETALKRLREVLDARAAEPA